MIASESWHLGSGADSGLLVLKDVRKAFGKIRAVDQLSIAVGRGELFGLLGPSGCGKTTTLRLILGLAEPDDGSVVFHGRNITAEPAEVRGFGMVFQNYALFTKLNVYENIAFGLRARETPNDEIRSAVESLLAVVRLPPESASRNVEQLSAGEQQRVAIARALAIRPEVLLMDEPLANLDMGLRRHTGDEIRALVKQRNMAALYVTHDQSEAFALCDRLAVMSAGKVLQIGTHYEIYEQPADLSVARFLGFNIIPVRQVGREFETIGGECRFPVHSRSAAAGTWCGALALAIRPEDIRFGLDECPSPCTFPAKIRQIVFGGSTTRVILDVNGVAMESLVLGQANASPGDECVIKIPPDRLLVLRHSE